MTTRPAANQSGSSETFCRRERPQLLLEGGRPTALFSAVGPSWQPTVDAVIFGRE
jgi:hypothetical protein